MKNSTPKPVKVGYRYGLILLIFGLFVIGVNVAMIYLGDRYLPKLSAVGIALTILAPVFFVFPGGSLDKMPESKDMGKALMSHAPTLHKVMWIAWGIVAVAIAIYALISFDPQYFR